MANRDLIGKVQTVLGPISGESMGITLPHEHILQDSSFLFVEPTQPREKEMAYQKLNLQNLSWVVRHVFNNVDNLVLDDESRAIQELLAFKEAGGSTVVEYSVRGLSGNPEGLARIAKATGLNIVMATGYYAAVTHPAALAKMTSEDIAEQFVRDIEVGFENTDGVRAGVIKAACGGAGTAPSGLNEADIKILVACALAQRKTGAAIAVHNMQGCFAAEIVDVLESAGADTHRIILMHADRWGMNPPVFPKLLQAGCYLEFDGFGTAELGLIPAPGFDYQINDAQRCDLIKWVISQGYLKSILISQDVWIKTRSSSYGGAGYAHILCNGIPLMKHKGITDKEIHTMMVENPRRVFPFA